MKPILFNTEMVRAILEGRKSQTRRVVKLLNSNCLDFFAGHADDTQGNSEDLMSRWEDKGLRICSNEYPEEGSEIIKYLYGRPGDRLWVRETHYLYGRWQKNGLSKTGRQKWKFKALGKGVKYFDCSPNNIATKKNETGWFKRPSIFMPKWAFRITLEITDIRVERVREIKWQDALAEGIKAEYCCKRRDCACLGLPIDNPVDEFKNLWNSINKKRGYSWESNAWVWVRSFKQIKEAHDE